MTTIPTIHLNGTGASTLRDEYWAASKALDAAAEALAAATCNGRDFYPQGASAYDQARHERDVAFQKLDEVTRYVDEILGGICDQMR
jgi:hypothetical protein